MLPGRWPQSRKIWLLSALPGTASSSRGQLQEMQIPQSWHQHPSLTEPACGWPPHRPHMEQDPEPSALRAAASPGQGCRSSSCNPRAGCPGKPRSGLHRDLRDQSCPHHPELLGPCLGGACGPSSDACSPSSAAQHQALPAAIELRWWVGQGPSGNYPKTMGGSGVAARGSPPSGWPGPLGIGGCRALGPRWHVWLSQHPLSLPLLAFLFLSF